MHLLLMGQPLGGAVGWCWMREAAVIVAVTIHDLIFVRDRRQTLGNCGMLGIATAAAAAAESRWNTQLCRKCAGMFPGVILNVYMLTNMEILSKV